MPKMQRWIVASKMVEVLDKELLEGILEAGGQIGGGWCEIHQHICVNCDNKERIEALLRERGFSITSPDDHSVYHPDYYREHTQKVPVS